MRKLLIFLSMFLICGLMYSEAIDGSQSFYIGNGAREVSLGYTGISELGSVDGALINAASIADTRRLINSLSLGGIGSGTGWGIVGIAYPFDFGVLGFNAIYSGTPFENALNLLMGGNISFAKPITENFYFGTGIKFLYGSSKTSDWALALDLGAIINNDTGTSGFGLNDYSYGIVLRNLGKIISLGNYDAFPPMTLGVGGSFYPIKFDIYKLKLIGDVNFPFYPLGFNLGIGVENILFDFVKIRAGYILSFPEKAGLSEVGPFSFGVGLTGKFKINRETNTSVKVKFGKEKLEDSTEVSINYSLQPQKFNGVEELSHSITFDVAWGYYDEAKPEIVSEVDNEGYFSPNFDGSVDSAKIKINIKDNTIVDGWKLEILDGNGKVIKTYHSVEKLKLRSLDVGKFFKQLFSRKQSVDIPEYIEWNGMDESGTKMPDGAYYARLTAWDENKNTTISDKKMITLDTVIPEVIPSYEYFIFSPNADNSKDELIVNLKQKGIQENDEINFIITDVNGGEVKSFNFKSQVPDVVRWDGKDNGGKIVPEGEYKAIWVAKDKAGNRTITPEIKITLVTNYQKVDLSSSITAFSPNNDGVRDNIIFYPKVSDSKGLEKWTLRITDSAGKVVRTFEGKGFLPNEIFWDGRGENRLTLKDGVYEAVLQLNFDSGNYPASQKLSLVLDTTPPEITVEPEYLSFSPNGDGKQDTLKFTHKIKGEEDDIIEAKILNEFGNIIYYNKSTVKEMSKEFVWNGLDKNFKPLPEGRYTYIVEGIDSVGNRSRFEVKNIFLKTGLEQISVQSDVLAISPKNPDANRRAVFTTSVGTKKGIVDFVFEILKDQNVVYSFKTNDYVEKIIWDGKDSRGNILSDGIYNYRLKVKYDFGDEPVSAIKPIGVDSVSPEVEILTKDYAFSPNGDGRKENFVIRQRIKGDSTDVYKASILDSKGNVVKSYTFTGNVPEEILWDGKDDKGVDMPEGVYRYRIEGSDNAMNKTVKEIPTIKLVRGFERLNVNVGQNRFSPALGQKLTFNLDMSSVEDLENASISIVDSTERILRTISLTNQRTQRVEWDGMLDRNQKIPDGVYRAVVSFDYASGNKITTNITIVADSTPPQSVVTISPEVFTPDGDGEDDVMFINLDLNDLTDVKNWQIRIFKVGEKKTDLTLFKTFNGKGKGKTLIQWDGTGDDKEDLVEAVQDYMFELSVEDEVGNKTNISREFTTGVLVERTPEGLRIRVSSILFAFDKATFVGDYQKPLNRIIFILRRIMSNPERYGLTKNFKIEISGHTDDIGEEDYNQRLSERRAKAVYDYLVKNDIDPALLTFVGYGESRPYKIIKSGMSREKINEYRSRNRRVEFFIRK
ncbi:MAG: gliding motility-associated C-terminal domain-containing protein [Brevinematales bacterium]|nr:gliding motility-associated C-terminal domain-containing protein [Brevinematales bacterium]